jgi:hypothetical protein
MLPFSRKQIEEHQHPIPYVYIYIYQKANVRVKKKELGTLPLEGNLLKTLHLVLKKIDIHFKPFTRNSLPGPEGRAHL